MNLLQSELSKSAEHCNGSTVLSQFIFYWISSWLRYKSSFTYFNILFPLLSSFLPPLFLSAANRITPVCEPWSRRGPGLHRGQLRQEKLWWRRAQPRVSAVSSVTGRWSIAIFFFFFSLFFNTPKLHHHLRNSHRPVFSKNRLTLVLD